MCSDLSDDGQEFGGSIYQKLSPKLQTGINLAWSAGSENTRFGVGAKYQLDSDASLRCKVNNASQIGLGYQQRLRDGKNTSTSILAQFKMAPFFDFVGVTLTLSALIDGKSINEGGHKIGLALDLEA